MMGLNFNGSILLFMFPEAVMILPQGKDFNYMLVRWRERSYVRIRKR
jgi:hypothetical protein